MWSAVSQCVIVGGGEGEVVACDSTCVERQADIMVEKEWTVGSMP